MRFDYLLSAIMIKLITIGDHTYHEFSIEYGNQGNAIMEFLSSDFVGDDKI